MLNENKRIFKDLSDDEKGALLLADHEGREVQYWTGVEWRYREYIDKARTKLNDEAIYRVKPESEFKTTAVQIKPGEWIDMVDKGALVVAMDALRYIADDWPTRACKTAEDALDLLNGLE